MEKNYYEILEVDKNASKEIIDKAYKTLAKKYHPDLQTNDVKIFEEKMKKINEAYAVLTNEEQREAYDQQLKDCLISVEEYQKLLQENIILKEKLNEIYNPVNDVNDINIQFNEEETTTQYSNQNNNFKQKCREYYIQNIRQKSIAKKSIKEHLKSLIALVLTILIFIIILQIPFVKRFFVQIYDDNVLIQTIVEIFKNIFDISK